MRLWHYKLIPYPYLSRQRLLGQNRECAALRGKGWGRKHSTVDYVFEHNFLQLTYYHKLVMLEMTNRGYKINNPLWYYDTYRGKQIGFVEFMDLPNIDYAICGDYNYFEHNDNYLKECLHLLKQRGETILFKEDKK